MEAFTKLSTAISRVSWLLLSLLLYLKAFFREQQKKDVLIFLWIVKNQNVVILTNDFFPFMINIKEFLCRVGNKTELSHLKTFLSQGFLSTIVPFSHFKIFMKLYV